MSKKNFSLPPVSPLMGTTIINYIRTLRGNAVQSKYYFKIFLTGLIILILTPFRWYETLVFRNRIKNARVTNPIFILGHWRSGTTFLHNLLSEDPNSGYVQTYQTVFPNHLATKWLFGALMKQIMPKQRPSDNVELSIDFPQEEEFGFMNTNPYSAYKLFYFPKNYSEFFDQSVKTSSVTEKVQKKIEADYLNLIKKAQIVSGKQQMIIKNPINTARINFLNKLFPQARYIHLVRNPYTVYVSSKKFFVNLLPTLYFNKVNESEISKMILDLYSRMYGSFDAQKEATRNLFEIKFEDLENNPLKQLEEVYAELAIDGFEFAKPHFIAYLAKQKDYEKNTYYIKQEEIDLINKKWGRYIEKWGYELPQNMKIV